MEKDVFKMPAHKVGIKLLTEQQMINVLPSYRSLLERIENHRKQIIKLNGERLRYYQYNMMYDNVFSVFGRRGTGKTSIAFTLQKNFRENEAYPYDVIMPIIIPEIIPSDCSALGWLLEIVGEKISEIFGRKPSEFCDSGDDNDFWRKCRYQDQSNSCGMLNKMFEEVIEFYYSIKYDPSAESSYTLAVGNSARQAQNYYKLSRKITELWDCFIEAIRDEYSKRNKNIPKENICPLIYFIFDDVDLAPEKVNELMSIIIKYLSHPNIIVLTTADEETVLEVIENRLDRNIGRIPKEWRHYLNKDGDITNEMKAGGEKSDLIGKLARLYLGKVMPTSTRYYLKVFVRADEKWRFWVDEKQQLGDALIQMMDQMQKRIGVSGKNFLKVQDTELIFYVNFFGNTSRQIGNTFLGVQELLEETTELLVRQEKRELNEQDQEILYESCRHFLQIALRANHNLAGILGDVDDFISEIFWLEHNNWKFYIGYNYLQNFLKELLTINKKENIIKATLQLYSLLLFVENILVIVDYWAENRVTRRTRVHGVKDMAQFLCEQVFQGKQKLRADLRAEEFFRHYNTTLNRIGYLFGLVGSSEKFDREYLYYFLDYSYEERECGEEALILALERNRDWLREIAGILSSIYGNMYLIGAKEIGNCLVYREKSGLSRYQLTIESILQSGMRESLCKFDIRETAEKEIEELKGIPKGFKTGNYGKYIEKLREDLCYDIENDVIGRLMEEYIDTYRDSYIAIKDQKSEEEFWGKFREEYDERIDIEYLKNRVIPLREIIGMIDELYKADSLEKLLKKLPKSMAEPIAQKLSGEKDKDCLLLSLNMMQNFLIQWDQKLHYIIFDDFHVFLSLAADTGRQRNDFIEILNTADYMQKEFPGWETEGRQWSLTDKTIYTTLRKELKRMCLLLENDKNSTGGSKNGIYLSIGEMGKTFDVAIDLEDKNDFRDAVIVGVIVQIMKRIQKLYLYQTVMEKYESRDNSSSIRLEEARIKSRVEKGADREKNSYYYAMFLTMKEILQREKAKDIEEEDTLKNFIAGAVLENRTQYLTKLINEVKDESNTD